MVAPFEFCSSTLRLKGQTNFVVSSRRLSQICIARLTRSQELPEFLGIGGLKCARPGIRKCASISWQLTIRTSYRLEVGKPAGRAKARKRQKAYRYQQPACCRQRPVDKLARSVEARGAELDQLVYFGLSCIGGGSEFE